MVDLGTYRALTCRAALKDKERDRLDLILKKVANYREKFPRPIDAPSPDSRAAEQRQIDDFLKYIATQASNLPKPTTVGSCCSSPQSKPVVGDSVFYVH